MGSRVADTADVHEDATLGDGTVVWHLAQVREGARLGRDCVIGRGAYIGAGVRLGDRVKVQNLALVYEPATLEEGVFVGPGAILTNDPYPRSIMPSGRPKGRSDWVPAGVTVRRGASIGAGAVCVAPVSIGAWALVAAGSVVVLTCPTMVWSPGSRPGMPAGWAGRVSGWRIWGQGCGGAR